MNLSIRQLLSKHREYITPAAILGASVITGIGLLLPSGIFPNVRDSFPRRVWFNSVKNIANYSELQSIIQSQPVISFRSNPKYYIVEVGRMDCIECASVHGVNKNGQTANSDKVFEEYIRSGKAGYVWIDQPTSNNSKSHASLYCAGEQSAKRFFQYRDELYRNSQPFTLDTARIAAEKANLDISEFESCVESGKYYERVNQLAQFANVILENTQVPQYYVYQITERKVTQLDGRTGKQTIAKQLTRVSAASPYEDVIKPSIDEVLR